VLTSKVDDFRLNNTNNNSKRQKVFTEIPHEAQQELQYSKAKTVIIAAVCYGNIKKKKNRTQRPSEDYEICTKKKKCLDLN